MTDLLFPTPPIFNLPLSKGGDLEVDFMNKVDGVYTDYADGVSITLVIDTDSPLTADAVMTGHHAVCTVQSEDADDVKSGTRWRCVLTTDSDIVVANGRVVRADG